MVVTATALKAEPPSMTAQQLADGRVLFVSGALTLAFADRLEPLVAEHGGSALARLDLSGVTALDTAGAWALARLMNHAPGAEITGATEAQSALLERVIEDRPKPDLPEAKPRGLLVWVEGVGRNVVGRGHAFAEMAGMFGLFLVRLADHIVRPWRFRFTALVSHCEAVGLQAVPIVALMSFLIGIVLAFQGASQLRQFGAEVFVVDLIAISILRELGILLTAIIVAGRTASAFTAAIGSMKMREEIDAMRTLGMDPGRALIVPRVLALFLMLPILGLIANVSGLLGGALMSWVELGISPQLFLTRLLDGTDVSHVWVGVSKAPVFALLIGIIGCHHGMKVKGNADSLGMMTSKSVVTAIFAVIVADAAFSIFFAEIGW